MQTPAAPVPTTKQVTVIGAGIAGATVAWTLAERGWSVRVLESGAGPGHGASGNPAAILYPKLVSAELTPEHLQSIAYLLALQRLQDPRLRPHFKATGVLWLADDKQAVIDAQHPWWQKQVWPLTAEEASAHAGIAVHKPALWLPDAGVLQPAGLLAALLDHPGITLICNTEVLHAEVETGHWRLLTNHGEEQASTLVIAHAGAARHLQISRDLPLRPVRGQISTLAACLPLRTTVCFGAYLTPAMGGEPGQHCLGATFQPDREDTGPTHEDQLTNRDRLLQEFPELAPDLPDVAQWQARASLRWQTPDYLPMAGALPDMAALRLRLASTAPGRHVAPLEAGQPQACVSLGHGSKGFTQAWVAAEIVALTLAQGAGDVVDGEVATDCSGATPPTELPATLIEMLRPERFLLRSWRRGRL